MGYDAPFAGLKVVDLSQGIAGPYCAMLLAQAIPGTNLECAFDLDSDHMTITVSVTAAEPQMPAKDTFAWTVLSALAGTVDSRLGPDDLVSIVLRKRRDDAGQDGPRSG